MKFMRLRFMLALMLTSISAIALGAADEIEAVKAGLQKMLPEMRIDRIGQSPVPGLYEVVFGTRIIYVSKDGNYLIQGDLFDAGTRQNMTAPVVAKLRLGAIESIGEQQMVVFSPQETKYTITVFTDIDCPYCRKLHQDIPALNANGVKVRYLLYPRAGLNSESYRKSMAVWCAEDSNAALTKAKAGEPIEMKSCDNPVKKHMELARAVGVTGTPTIVFEESGEVLPGYVPVERLMGMLSAE